MSAHPLETKTVGFSEQQSVIRAATEVLQKHAKSFRLASYFLPKKSAADAAVVYQFCRLVDDLVDEAPSYEIASQNLSQLSLELSGVVPARVEVEAYLDVSNRLGIPAHAADSLMAGVLSDIRSVRVCTDRELAVYCYRVAGVVGLMMCPVLGVKDVSAHARAVDLGMAMQLTNICRDVVEDAKRDRVYLPTERLSRHLITPDQLVTYLSSDEPTFAPTQIHEATQKTVSELLELAEQCYSRSLYGMGFIPFRARAAILIARRVYRRIGVRLLKKYGGNSLHGRTIVPGWQKGIQVICGLLDVFRPVTWSTGSISKFGSSRSPEEIRNQQNKFTNNLSIERPFYGSLDEIKAQSLGLSIE